MNKKIKIISGITLLGVITIAVVTPIVVVSQQNKKAIQKANDELKAILDKLSGKEVIISEGVDVSTKEAFQKAIINALKIDDKIKLSNEQLSKISLVSNLITEVNVFKKIALKVNIDKANIKNDVIINVKIEKSAKTIANEKIKKDKALFNGFKDFKINGSKVNIIPNNSDIKNLKVLTDLNVNPKLVIPTPTPGVARKYDITTDKITGIATVTVTFSATDGDNATETFSISGFKTTTTKNKEDANAKIAADKLLITNYKDQTIIGKPDRIANGGVTKAKLESLSGFNKLPTLTQDVTRAYNITTDEHGVATVTVTFSANHGDNDTKTFTISGFKTTAAKNKEVANAKIATDKTLITNYGNQTISGTPDPIANGAVTKAKLESLNGFNTLPILTQDVTRAYNITTDEHGVAAVTVTFSANHGDNDTETFSISGFKTTAAKNKEVANAKIAADKALITTYGNQTISGTPDQISNGAVTKAKLESLNGFNTLPTLTQDVTRAYNITTDEHGVTTVTVTFSANHGDNDTETFSISGFKTTAAKNKEVANAKIAADKALITTYGNQTISGTPDQIANGAVTKAKLESLNGFNTLPPLTQDVTRAYNITTDATTGIATVIVTFSANHGDNDTERFSISGFKTTTAKNKEVANAKIAADKALITTYGNQTISGTPDQIANGAVTKAKLESLNGFNTLPPLTQDVTRAYNITTDEHGVATVTVTFSINHGDNDTETFSISGFKTTAAKNKEVANAKIAADKALITTYGNQTISDTPDQIANGGVTKAKLESLNGFNTLPPLTQDVTRAYNITTDEHGVATVTVTFSTNHGDNDTERFSISGFKTTAAKNKEVANAKIAADKALITTYGNQTISDTPDQIANGAVTKAKLESLNGFNTLPPLTQDVTRAYNITIDEHGVATVTVTFSTNHGDNDTERFSISGFKTTAAKNKEVANAKIAADKALITTYGNQTIIGTPDQIANGAVTKAKLESLNGFNTLPPLTQDVTRAYNITIDEHGVATVTVTFSTNHGDNDTERFSISGFKTTAAKNKEVANAKIAADKALITTYGNQTIIGTPDQIANGAVTKAKLESLNGFNTLPPLTQDVTRAYNITTDEHGLATVIVTFSANDGNNVTETFTISGFDTIAKRKSREDKAVVEKEVQKLNNNSLTFSSKGTTLNTEVTTKGVVDAIKKVSAINLLTNAQKALIVVDDIALDIAIDGTLKITIQNHGKDKVLTIKGFDTKVRANKAMVEKEVQKLNNNSLTFSSKGTTLNTEVTTKGVVDAIKKVSAINSLTNDQKALIVVGDIALDTKIDGTLVITIANHGPNKKLTITSFDTMAKRKTILDKAAVKTAVQKLNDNSLVFASKGTILNIKVTIKDVFDAIKKLSAINSLTDAQKLLILEDDISLGTKIDGTLVITIANHGPNKVLKITGFDTMAKRKTIVDKVAVKKAVQKLNDNSLVFASKGTTLNTEVTTKDVVDTIKKVSAINSLTDAQKVLILESDLTLDTTIDGTLKITIQNHGLDKSLNITGFETKAKRKIRDEAIVTDIIQKWNGYAINAILGPRVFHKKEIPPQDVVLIIRNYLQVKGLTKGQLALITEKDIGLIWSQDRSTLTVIIHNHGVSKWFWVPDNKWII